METLTHASILPGQARQQGGVVMQRKKADCHVNLALADFVLRIFCEVFCIAVLVASAFVLSSIDKVDDFIDDFNNKDHRYNRYGYGYDVGDLEYENANGYRGVAEWMICIASLGIIFHLVMLLFRYVCCRVHVRSQFAGYSYVNAAVCVIFALGFFSGAVANAVFANENADNVDDVSFVCSHDLDACNDLKRVRDSEVATAAMGFIAMLVFIAISIVMILSGVVKMPDAQGREQGYSLAVTHVPPAQVSANVVRFHTTEAPPPYVL